MDAAAARPEPIPVYAEMGSINPVFLLPGALRQNAETLATGLHASVTLGVGQFCTNPGLVFMHAGAASELFVRKLESLMAGTAPGTMLTADLCASYREGVEKFGKVPGVKRASAQAPPASPGPAQASTALFLTDAGTFLKTPALMEEVFGPSTLVVHGTPEELLTAAKNLESQLTATIHGTPEDLAANRDLLSILGNESRPDCL